MWENVTPDFATTADIGDGTITITKSDGTEVGSFTVNQAGDTTIAASPADVVPSDPNFAAVLATGNDCKAPPNIADGGLVRQLQPTGVVDASRYVASTAMRPTSAKGCLLTAGRQHRQLQNGMPRGSTLRLRRPDIQQSASQPLVKPQLPSGGWGARYFFSASTTFISISNDNPSGKPTPDPWCGCCCPCLQRTQHSVWN